MNFWFIIPGRYQTIGGAMLMSIQILEVEAPEGFHLCLNRIYIVAGSFWTKKKLYQNTDIWCPYWNQLAQETRIVPRYSDKIILGSYPITPESVKIIFTSTWEDTMNVLVIRKRLVSSAILSQYIIFKPLFSPVIFYDPRGKYWNRSASRSSYDSIRNICTPT